MVVKKIGEGQFAEVYEVKDMHEADARVRLLGSAVPVAVPACSMTRSPWMCCSMRSKSKGGGIGRLYGWSTR